MNIGNRRGIVEWALAFWILTAVVGTILAWKPVSQTLGIGNQPQKQKSSMSKKVESKPVFIYKDEKGFDHYAMATKVEENTLDSSEESKLTLWQKIKNMGLGFVILMIAFPGTIGAFGIKAFLKGKDNLAQLVKGVEEAKTKLPKESIDILDTSLSKKLDQSVKTQVKKIKVKL